MKTLQDTKSQIDLAAGDEHDGENDFVPESLHLDATDCALVGIDMDSLVAISEWAEGFHGFLVCFCVFTVFH